MSKNRPFASIFNFSQFMIQDLYRKYPQFYEMGPLQFCSCVYYPIAQLELEIIENSSEEFDSIEYTILEIIDAGITDPAFIANMLGISENYVRKIIIILEGYGHLYNMKLTDIGKKSIQEEVKYTEYLVRQSFQADPIFGNFIKKEMIQPTAYLLNRDETINIIPHVQPDPYIEEELLTNLLQDLKPYQKKKSRLFHMNAKRIERVVDKKITFAYAFLLKFSKMNDPVVVMRCKEEEYMEKASDAFYWKPVAIPVDVAHYFSHVNELDETERINVVATERFKHLHQLQHDILNQLQFVREKRYEFPKRVEPFLSTDWRLSRQFSNYHIRDNIIQFQIELEHINEFDERWLRSLGHYDVGLDFQPYVRFASNHRYPGVVCYAKTNNEKYKSFIKKYQQEVLHTDGNIEEFYESNKQVIEQLMEEADSLRQEKHKELMEGAENLETEDNKSQDQGIKQKQHT